MDVDEQENESNELQQLQQSFLRETGLPEEATDIVAKKLSGLPRIVSVSKQNVYFTQSMVMYAGKSPLVANFPLRVLDEQGGLIKNTARLVTYMRAPPQLPHVSPPFNPKLAISVPDAMRTCLALGLLVNSEFHDVCTVAKAIRQWKKANRRIAKLVERALRCFNRASSMHKWDRKQWEAIVANEGDSLPAEELVRIWFNIQEVFRVRVRNVSQYLRSTVIHAKDAGHVRSEDLLELTKREYHTGGKQKVFYENAFWQKVASLGHFTKEVKFVPWDDMTKEQQEHINMFFNGMVGASRAAQLATVEGPSKRKRLTDAGEDRP